MRLLYNLLFICFIVIQFSSQLISQSGTVLLINNTSQLPKTSMNSFLSEDKHNQIIAMHDGNSGNDIIDKKKKKRIQIIAPDQRALDGKERRNVQLRKLDKKLKKEAGVDLLIQPGCPGPEVIEVSDHLVFIVIDSEWFFLGDDRPQYAYTKCQSLWENDVWAEIEDAVEDHEEKHAFIVGYHSISKRPESNTSFSFLYPHDGPIQDYNSRTYEHFRKRMTDILHSNKNVKYINLSGAKKTKYRPEHKELFVGSEANTEIQFVDGEIIITSAEYQTTINPLVSLNGEKSTGEFSAKRTIDTLITAGKRYKAGSVKEFWLGKNFRQEWITPTKIPMLYLNDFKGGVKPYSKGGGLQTVSLKMKDVDGRKFAFRSVDKAAKKNKENIVLTTAVGEVKQDQISTQLPFGDIFVGKLLDYTDILHSTPEAYVMADQVELGQFREEFKGILATVEEKPTGKKKGRKGTHGADKIFSTHDVYRSVLKDNDNRIDAQAYARATMFDVWIADWDRHQDNWKWAGYKTDNGWIYKPIPRDRDHAFALWEGLIGNVSDLAAPNVAEFREKVVDMKGMTFQGKSMLKFLGSTITEREWMDAALYIEYAFDKKKIEEAWSHMPSEIAPISKGRMIRILDKRRSGLLKASQKIYRLFNKHVAIYGSDKDDFIQVFKNEDGSISIKLFDEKGKTPKGQALFENTYFPDITKEIALYGLDGNDVIDVKGIHKSDIHLILVPGTDKDIVTTQSTLDNTRVLDTQKYDFEHAKELKDPLYPNLYDFNYDAILPFAMYKYDSDFGSGFEVAFTQIKQKFNKSLFGRRSVLAFKYYPRGNSLRAKLKTTYNDIYDSWDGVLYIRGALNDTRYDRFFGTDSALPMDYLRNYRSGDDYYVSNTNIDSRYGLSKAFFGKSVYNSSVGAHFLNFKDGTGPSSGELLGDENIFKSYWLNELNLDFLDNAAYPTHGLRYTIDNQIGFNFLGETGLFTRTNASILGALSWHDFSKTIWLVKIGGESSSGNRSYIDFPILGNNQHVRGAVNNLIRASTIGYLNAELRKEVYESKNKYLPYTLGLMAFYDQGWTYDSKANNAEGYGGGLYISVLDHKYNVYFTIAESDLADGLFFQYGLGFSLNR